MYNWNGCDEYTWFSRDCLWTRRHTTHTSRHQWQDCPRPFAPRRFCTRARYLCNRKALKHVHRYKSVFVKRICNPTHVRIHSVVASWLIVNPWLHGCAFGGTACRTTHTSFRRAVVVFVLDASASMNARGPTGLSFLNCAKLVRIIKLRSRGQTRTCLRDIVYYKVTYCNAWPYCLLLCW